jgi:hypothetical protein
MSRFSEFSPHLLKICHGCPSLAIFRPYPGHIRWGPEQRLLHMTNQQDMFDERYRKVLKRHRQLSRGYVTKLQKNGVIAHHPIGHVRERFSLSMLLIPLAVLFVLKACVVTVLGPSPYAQKVEALSEGGFLEQVGAILMQMDPITRGLSSLMGTIIG